DVAVALDVDDFTAFAALDEDRLAADLAHRPDRRVDPARKDLPGAVVDGAHARVVSAATLGVRRVPFGVVRREVLEPDLLVLGRRVERGAVVGTHFAGLGDRVEHRVALLLGAAVGHREDDVGPVVVGRPLVAVADPAGRRHGG